MGKTHIRQKAVFSVAAGMILIPLECALCARRRKYGRAGVYKCVGDRIGAGRVL